MKAFTVMGRVLKATYEELFLCVFLSLLFWLGQVLVVTAAPAMVGLNHVFNRSANYKRVDSGFFWEGARDNIGRGWILYLILLGAPVLFAFQILFYGNSGGYWRIFSVFWIWVLLFSLMIGQYFFALLWQQDEPDLLLVLRNAALLAIRHPLYSFLMLLFNLVVIILSVGLALPLLLLAPSVLSLSGNFALVGLLQEMDLAPQPPEVPKR